MTSPSRPLYSIRWGLPHLGDHKVAELGQVGAQDAEASLMGRQEHHMWPPSSFHFDRPAGGSLSLDGFACKATTKIERKPIAVGFWGFFLGTWTKPLRGRGDQRPSSLIAQ